MVLCLSERVEEILENIESGTTSALEDDQHSIKSLKTQLIGIFGCDTHLMVIHDHFRSAAFGTHCDFLNELWGK